MDGRKAGIAVLLTLMALGFFTGQSSARSMMDFASIIQRPEDMWLPAGLKSGDKFCESCICGGRKYPGVPKGFCECMDYADRCKPKCRNCDCWGVAEVLCTCKDPIYPRECRYTDGLQHPHD